MANQAVFENIAEVVATAIVAEINQIDNINLPYAQEKRNKY
ncbi:MAG: hypothetical protein ABW189_00050 [Rickettsiales bacterium]